MNGPSRDPGEEGETSIGLPSESVRGDQVKVQPVHPLPQNTQCNVLTHVS